LFNFVEIYHFDGLSRFRKTLKHSLFLGPLRSDKRVACHWAPVTSHVVLFSVSKVLVLSLWWTQVALAVI